MQRFFFQPTHIDYRVAQKLGLEPQLIITPKNTTHPNLKVSDVELKSWFLPAKTSAHIASSKGTVIFLHGNAQNISAHIGSVHWLPARGYDVLLIEYRGYGSTDGSPSFNTIFSDINRQITHWYDQEKGQKERVFLFGQSLGGSIATKVAIDFKEKQLFCALILEGVFSNYRRIAQEKIAAIWLTYPFQKPLSYLFSVNFNPDELMTSLNHLPILIIHSTEDEIIPLHHGKILFKQTKQESRPDDLASDMWVVSGPHIRAMATKEGQDRFLSYLDNQRCHHLKVNNR